MRQGVLGGGSNSGGRGVAAATAPPTSKASPSLAAAGHAARRKPRAYPPCAHLQVQACRAAWLQAAAAREVRWRRAQTLQAAEWQRTGGGIRLAGRWGPVWARRLRHNESSLTALWRLTRPGCAWSGGRWAWPKARLLGLESTWAVHRPGTCSSNIQHRRSLPHLNLHRGRLITCRPRIPPGCCWP